MYEKLRQAVDLRARAPKPKPQGKKKLAETKAKAQELAARRMAWLTAHKKAAKGRAAFDPNYQGKHRKSDPKHRKDN